MQQQSPTDSRPSHSRPRRRPPARALAAAALGGVLLAGLAGCSPSASAGSSGITIVASTDVYGDIAKQLGGADVSVTSIIDDPAQDPHSYEGDVRVQLALSKADIVISNGGGYDDFVGTLMKGASNSKAILLNVATISGLNQHPATGEFNEHLWYDFPTVQKFADALTAKLVSLDPGHATTFASKATAFAAKLKALESGEAEVKASSAGKGVAITEPVPLYLLQAAGLANKTPAEFSEAVEEGTDVPPVVLQQTLALFSDHAVRALVYNAQTSGPETDAVLAAAQSAGIAVVPVTETLPKGDDYIGWMTDNLAAVRAALQ